MGDKSWFYTVVGHLSAAANVHQRPELRDETHRACKLAMAEHDKEHAVIEAAKAWRAAQLHEPYRDDEDQRDRENITTFALQDAIEALQEVE